MINEWGDEYVLALTAWREASDQGLPGMQAVMCVVRNRAVKGGTSVSHQCVARNQFTSMSVKGDPNTVRWPGSTETPWLVAQTLAHGVINGTLEDSTNGALYYANLTIANSKWFTTNIINDPINHPVVAKIGDHTFYA